MSEPIETAWLIERRDYSEICYLTVEGSMFTWHPDSLKAIRFCRREDVERMAEIFENEDIHLVEHQWG